MKNALLASVALIAAPLMIAGMAAPAAAQSKLAIAIVNVDQAIGTSAAAQTATTQMQTTYKSNIDDVNTRQTALQTELKTKEDALRAAITAAGQKPTPAQQTALQGQYDALQKRAQEAQNELQNLQVPLQRARAYVIEQIAAKIPDALKNVMTKNKVDLLLKDNAAEAFQPSVDLTSALVTELNTLVPTVGIVPPANWQPGGQQAAPAAAAPAATTPAAPAATTPPPANRPSGR
ncbi:MAG: OmpH family outer membrane protein [Sphingobium sp.]|nr:OmpH family outer membrane protein [Sphingobium sp.]